MTFEVRTNAQRGTRIRHTILTYDKLVLISACFGFHFFAFRAAGITRLGNGFFSTLSPFFCDFPPLPLASLHRFSNSPWGERRLDHTETANSLAVLA